MAGFEPAKLARVNDLLVGSITRAIPSPDLSLALATRPHETGTFSFSTALLHPVGLEPTTSPLTVDNDLRSAQVALNKRVQTIFRRSTD